MRQSTGATRSPVRPEVQSNPASHTRSSDAAGRSSNAFECGRTRIAFENVRGATIHKRDTPYGYLVERGECGERSRGMRRVR